MVGRWIGYCQVDEAPLTLDQYSMHRLKRCEFTVQEHIFIQLPCNETPKRKGLQLLNQFIVTKDLLPSFRMRETQERMLES